jgi:guanylate kinase
MGRLVILSGPSCVGKGPLYSALQRFYPELAGNLKKLCLYNSRAARPGEEDGVDYHFRPREEIQELDGEEGYMVMDVRGDLQALDLRALEKTMKDADAFFEGNPFVGTRLLDLDVKKLAVFLAPLCKEEVLDLKRPEHKVDLQAFVTDIQRRKLLRRTKRQKTNLSLKDLENIERRAGSAYREMKDAHRFRYVIPSHDGEDSENWDAFYHPVADARKALQCFAALLQGKSSDYAEQWEEELLP